ncbi:MAG: glycosyl hydrolase family 18 protein [Defluviitaleaceae bacterium]|nr:glycosyl hydrolase family 18 protein [Defluviitaleaceae bacterium]
MNKNLPKRLAYTAISVVVTIAVFAVILALVVPRVRDFQPLQDLLPGTTVVDFHTHFSLNPSVPQIIFDDQRVRYIEPPIVEDGRVYLRADFLRNEIDPFAFWDEGAGVLFVSTLYEMLEFAPGRDFVLMNGSPTPLDHSIIRRDGDIFVPAEIVQMLYPLLVDYREAYNMVVITSRLKPQTRATISANRANVRYWPADRAPITAQLTGGDVLLVFDSSDEYVDVGNFVRVRTEDGLLGYVLASQIEGLVTEIPDDHMNRFTLLDDFIDNTSAFPQLWDGGAVNLIWENIYHHDANRESMNTPLHPSLTAVAPFWFRISEYGTHLTSLASREYVDWAHEQGVQVWPVVFDVGYMRSAAFLTNRASRRYAINQLIEAADTFNFDGLNIDFEHLTAAEGDYKIQFLRELAIPMRERGVVLSAAVKVPIPASAFYQRDLIGKTVCLVMVMAYDEHWATSPVAGPNASLPWVRRGVDNMLLEVPPDRLVLGLPFYNRIWREFVSSGEVEHYRALGTNSTRAFFEERGVTWEWDFELGSYFGEVAAFEDGETVIYRVWLEDARSIQEKMNIFTDNNLAGVAAWQRMLAIDEFWDVIAPYFP